MCFFFPGSPGLARKATVKPRGRVWVTWGGPVTLCTHRLSPSLQLGQVHAIRRRFSPGCSSPASACSICSWICVGLSPLIVTLLPDTFCTVSCCCPGGKLKSGGVRF